MTTKTLTERLTELVTTWQQRENELIDWLTGSKDGGPESDGKYPLTTRSGDVRHIMSPAAVADMVSGPAAKAEDEASAAKQSALTATKSAEDSLSYSQASEEARSAAQNDADRAERARSQAENAESNVRTRANKHFPNTKTFRVPNKTGKNALQDMDPGTFGWDDNYLYVRTTNSVKRIPLESI